ncbi:hypothetical protein SADUNF_Sadunf13G0106300 [Salix dunnii]|uniref:Uncharacterized protein n=1 Tax=Salix dunnii TaxID=1413687 RepID=A0A835JLU5_9ROSI|nr:hypothetical protein SADUNF_Sadunf13G0106300 [Salix dunnii]
MMQRIENLMKELNLEKENKLHLKRMKMESDRLCKTEIVENSVQNPKNHSTFSAIGDLNSNPIQKDELSKFKKKLIVQDRLFKATDFRDHSPKLKRKLNTAFFSLKAISFSSFINIVKAVPMDPIFRYASAAIAYNFQSRPSSGFSSVNFKILSTPEMSDAATEATTRFLSFSASSNPRTL